MVALPQWGGPGLSLWSAESLRSDGVGGLALRVGKKKAGEQTRPPHSTLSPGTARLPWPECWPWAQAASLQCWSQEALVLPLSVILAKTTLAASCGGLDQVLAVSWLSFGGSDNATKDFLLPPCQD